MKILFAAPDRDLLECFKQLLETDLGETVTAFDGTQVISLLMSENFDVLLLDRNVPRVDHKTIVGRANEKNVPVIVLTDEPAGVRRTGEPSAYGRLAYPFTFAKIKKTILDTLERRGVKETKRGGDQR
jgi:DNA-binding NtrC family response regulator